MGKYLWDIVASVLLATQEIRIYRMAAQVHTLPPSVCVTTVPWFTPEKWKEN